MIERDRLAATFRTGAAIVMVLIVAACGGGGVEGPPAQVPSRISGALFGTLTRDGQSYAAFAIANDGRWMAVDAGNFFYDGAYSVSEGRIRGSNVRVYGGDPVGRPFIRQVTDQTATLSAVVTTAGWDGTLATAAGTIAFDLDYQPELDAQDSALSFVAGDWRYTNDSYQSLLAVAADGATATTNTSNGGSTFCDSTGQASILDADYGAYGWATTLSGAGCGNLAGQPYTGFGILSDSTAPLDRLTVFLANGSYFLSYRSYQRQP